MEPQTPVIPETLPETPLQAPNPQSPDSIGAPQIAGLLFGFLALGGLGYTGLQLGFVPGMQDSLPAAVSRAEHLKVTSPNGEEVWTVGSTQNITWSGGLTGWKMDLLLMDEAQTETIKTIATSTANTRSYPWTITSDISAGRYSLKVACKNCKSNVSGRTDFSDAAFTISTSSSMVTLLSSRAWVDDRQKEINFDLTYRVSSGSNPIYISPQATSTLIHRIERNGVEVWPSTTWAYGTDGETKPPVTPNGNIKVEVGKSLDFVLTVSAASTTPSGMYQFKVTGVRWSSADDWTAENIEPVDLKTNYVSFTR